MYKDSKKDRFNFFAQLSESYFSDPLPQLKPLNEDEVSLKDLENYSNPGLDIITWRGEGEMPTTIKGADMDDIAKKIAAPYGEDLKATEVFEAAYDEFFLGKTNTYAPYDNVGDDTDIQSLIERDNMFYEMYVREEADSSDEKDSKGFEQDLEDLKDENDENNVDSDHDDDDDEDDDDESINEGYFGLNLDEDSNDYDEEDYYVEEGHEPEVDYRNASPISLLEDNEADIVNLDTLLEQTQMIEDELDQISYSSVQENAFSNVFSEEEDVLADEMLDESFEEDLLEDVDYSDYLDEDIL